MTQTVHIFRKDFRRLRWALVGWCAIVAARALVDTVGEDIALGGFGPLVAIRQMWSMLSVIYVLMLVILVARLVQDEPLVGRDAFWLTRPIASTSVVRAKLAFVTVFLILVPLAARALVAARFGTPVEEIIKIVPPFLFNQLIAITVLWALAALTPSLTRYVITIVGIIGAFVLFTASTLLIAMFVVAVEPDDSGDYQFPDMTPAVVAGALIVLTAVAVIAMQYRTRRVSRALIAGFIGLLLVFFVPPNWKWSFAAFPAAEIVSSPPDVPSLSVTLDGSKPRVGESMALNRTTPPRKEIAVPAIVTGFPPEFNVRALVGRSRLELPNGVVLEDLRRRTGVAGYLYGGFIVGRESAIEAALGRVRLLNRTPSPEVLSGDQFAVVLRVAEQDFARHRSEPGRLTTDLDVAFERGFPRASLPLVDGASTESNGVRNTIVRVVRRATGCTVLFRRSYVEPLFSQPRARRDLTYALLNQARREAVSASGGSFHEQGFSAGGFFLPPVRIGGRGFVLDQYDLEFPERRGFNAAVVDLDESWLNGAELVALEMVDAGRLTRRITLDKFRMTP